MNKFRLNINGKEVTGVAGQTILEVARENDIFIPTLCYDERSGRSTVPADFACAK